ncbi:MAG TPA: hypothetical protein VGK90_03450 [Rhizomicrobium sp.]|jgi:hypothetical protein
MPSSFSGSAIVLGIEIVFASNSPEALKAALSIFAARDDDKITVPASPVSVTLTANRIVAHTADVNHIRGKQLHIVRNGICVQADGDRGLGSCSFCMDVTDTELFREAVNTVVLFLVSQRDRTPVHASAVLIRDCAFVLAGRSGAGKSTLALAGNRIGLTVLAEDTVFVQREPSFRVWGLADHIHVFEKDAPPVVDGPTRLRSGRLKRILPVDKTQRSTDKAALCVLEHGGRIALDPLPVEDAVGWLTRELESGYDFYGSRMNDALRAIAVGGCWRLTLSDDPRGAISVLLDAFGNASADRQPD